MPFHRLKRSFTAGILTELLRGRVNHDRYINGSFTLRNMYVHPQGPTSNRAGFKYLADIGALTGFTDLENQSSIRLVPFIFNEEQSYVLIFYKHSSGTTRIAFVYGEGLIEDPASPGNPYIYEITGTFDPTVFQYAQSADILYMVQDAREPLELRRNAHDNWSVQSITFTSAPSDWSTSNGWPSLVSFYEQRICYASTLTRPQTLWFSKSADFYNFSVSSPILSDDAVTFTLDSGRQNRIQWLASTQDLLVGTMGGEWTVSGSGGSPLSFDSIKASRHTNLGGEKFTPVMIGHTTLFLERFGKRVNSFNYEYTFNSYTTNDLSILAPHLTEETRIDDWSYQQFPSRILWTVLEDGKLAGLTYQREHEVVGWHVHDTQGSFLKVSSIPGTDRDHLYSLVSRVVGGVTKWYLELQAGEFIGENPKASRFLDSYLEYSGTATNTLTGFDHLEGLEVSAIVNGAAHPPIIVTGGLVTLNGFYTDIIVGLSYVSECEPALPDIQDREGTTLGRKQQIVQADISFYRSIGCSVILKGEDRDEEVWQIPFRSPAHPTGESVPPYTGQRSISLPTGYDREPRLVIRQEQPLPLTIRGITYDMSVGDS